MSSHPSILCPLVTSRHPLPPFVLVSGTVCPELARGLPEDRLSGSFGVVRGCTGLPRAVTAGNRQTAYRQLATDESRTGATSESVRGRLLFIRSELGCGNGRVGIGLYRVINRPRMLTQAYASLAVFQLSQVESRHGGVIDRRAYKPDELCSVDIRLTGDSRLTALRALCIRSVDLGDYLRRPRRSSRFQQSNKPSAHVSNRKRPVRPILLLLFHSFHFHKPQARRATGEDVDASSLPSSAFSTTCARRYGLVRA